MHVKKGDTVLILAGKDKGKTGKILRSLPKESRVLVEGINIRKVHQKPKTKGGKGTVVDRAHSIHVSNVRLGDKKKVAKSEKKPAAKSKAK